MALFQSHRYPQTSTSDDILSLFGIHESLAITSSQPKVIFYSDWLFFFYRQCSVFQAASSGPFDKFFHKIIICILTYCALNVCGRCAMKDTVHANGEEQEVVLL